MRLILHGLAIFADLCFAELVGQFARAEHRQLARVHRHQSIPLSVGHLAVVVFGELLHLAQGLDAACRRAQCLAVVVERLLAGDVSRLLCLQMLRGHIGSSEDGILDGCEVGVFQLRTNQLLDVLHQLAQLVVFTQIALQLVAEGKGIELRVACWRQSTLVFLLVEFHLAPSHELRLSDGRELVELAHHGQQLVAAFLAELLGEPRFEVVVQPCYFVTLLPCYFVKVPRHIEEQRQLIGSHLRVVDVGNPHAACSLLIGGRHLVVEQARLRGGEPQIVVWTSPVRQVVVDAVTTLAPLLQRVGQTREVAVVVVAPHEHHVVGHAYAVLIDVEHLLVGNEHHRSPLRTSPRRGGF